MRVTTANPATLPPLLRTNTPAPTKPNPEITVDKFEASAPAAPQNQPPRYAESSRRWQRDALLLAGGVTAALIPGGAILGATVGGLAALTGLGELHEGARRNESREALGGATHLLAGGLIAASSLAAASALSPVLLAGAGAILLLKTVANHPLDLAKNLGRETLGLVSDGARVAGQGLKAGWQALTHR